MCIRDRVVGNVLHEKDNFGNYLPFSPDVLITGGFSDVISEGQLKTRYHDQIRVNYITGRAQLETWEGEETK